MLLALQVAGPDGARPPTSIRQVRVEFARRKGGARRGRGYIFEGYEVTG